MKPTPSDGVAKRPSTPNGVRSSTILGFHCHGYVRSVLEAQTSSELVSCMKKRRRIRIAGSEQLSSRVPGGLESTRAVDDGEGRTETEEGLSGSC